MKKMALFLALLLFATGCGAQEPASREDTALVSAAASEAAASAAAASEAAASEAIASEAIVSAAAASEAAASAAAASEAAASEAAASEAAASEAAAKAALKAAQSAAEQAALEAAKAAEQAAAEAQNALTEEITKATTKPTAKSTLPKASSSDVAASEHAAPASAPVQNKVVTGTNYLSKVEQKVLTLQNEERASRGLPALSYNQDLRSAARLRSKELYQNDLFAHARPDGQGWETILEEEVVVDYATAGENLCMVEFDDPDAHYDTDPEFWVNKWIESPEHYKNMLRNDFTDIGVGIYSIHKNGMTYSYATTIFASYR